MTNSENEPLPSPAAVMHKFSEVIQRAERENQPDILAYLESTAVLLSQGALSVSGAIMVLAPAVAELCSRAGIESSQTDDIAKLFASLGAAEESF